MTDTNEKEILTPEQDSSGQWMGWLGITLGAIAFMWWPFLMGGAAIVLGAITLFSKAKTLGYWSIGLGVLGMFFNGWIY
ncbi:C4-dicarboxylate ABC transporter [Ammoniphilus sp. YIM 78166]|uniref:C4-dicarboxylate ABC transporter n=1 Tax=Ammoniphilus sp. YIM 78166 TaxID=1644106 RepID=UPI00106FDB64|nr:C4-dicarboxylate ABC transporter [Ammoniphilus sp. YIM 78166]